MKFFDKAIFVMLVLTGILVFVFTVVTCLKINNASITMKYFKPHEYAIWEECMNDSNMKDVYKPSGFFLYHNYISHNKYVVQLCTESKCMDCWYVRINEHIYNTEYYFDTVTPTSFNSRLCEELAHKIIKDKNLTWENTHKEGEYEEKCFYHRLLK